MAHGITSTGYSFPDGTTKTTASKTIGGAFINNDLGYGLITYSGHTFGVIAPDQRSIIVWKGNNSSINVVPGQRDSQDVVRHRMITFPPDQLGTIIQAGLLYGSGFALFSTGDLYEWGVSIFDASLGNPSLQFDGEGDAFAEVTQAATGLYAASQYVFEPLRNSPIITATSVQKVYPSMNSPEGHTASNKMFIKKMNGTFWGKGYNLYGGLGAMGTQRIPNEVAANYSVPNTSDPAAYPSQFLYWKEMTSITANSVADDKFFNVGGVYGCVVYQTTDNNIYAFGNNGNSRMGTGGGAKYEPINITASWGGTGGGDVVFVSGGNWETNDKSNLIMLRRTNSTTETIWTCGHNVYGECGDGTTTSPRTTPFSRVLGTNGTDAVGSLHVFGSPASCFYVRAGKMWRWGHNAQGQLGNGTTTTVSTPDLTATSPNGYAWSKILLKAWGATSASGGGTGNLYTSTIFANDVNGNVFSAGYNNVNQRCGSGITITNNFTECPQLIGCQQVAIAGENNGFSFIGVIPGYDRGNGTYSKSRVVQWGHANSNECWTGTSMTGTNPTSPISVFAFGV